MLRIFFMKWWWAVGKPEGGDARETWGNSQALDQLRFLAALLVMLHHFRGFELIPDGLSGMTRFTYVWLRWGSEGVSLFLVLSAFLFTMNSDIGSRKTEYWPFIRKRLFRILPIYLLVGVLLMTQKRAQWSVLDFLTFATFQVNAGHPITGYGFDVLPIGPIWTIGVEFQFYLLFPLLIAALPPRGWLNCSRILGIIGVMIAFRYLMRLWNADGAIYFNAYHTLLGRFDQFLIGMLAAAFYVKFRARITPLAGFGAMVGATTIATMLLYNIKQAAYPGIAFSFTIEALIAAAVIIGMLAARGVPGWIGRRLAELGRASYSIYLLHLPVGVIMMKKFGGFNGGTLEFYWMKIVILVIIPTILISLVTYHCIEKPFMDLGRSDAGKAPPHPA